MMSPDLARAVGSAAALAAGHGRETEVGHLLLALLEDPSFRAVVESCGPSASGIGETLAAAYLGPAGPGAAPARTPGFSSDLTRTLALAADGSGAIDVASFLSSLAAHPHHPAARLLSSHGLDLGAAAGAASAVRRSRAILEREIPAEVSAYCTDLVLEAVRGRLEDAEGREQEVSRVVDVLRRRKKGNPILVGEPGVGKTAIVEGLAFRIMAGRAGDGLANARIMALDVAAIVAGSRNRGDFEERLKGLVSKLESDRDLILFVDEAHVLVGGTSGASDAANLLKPALASGRIRCIAATTHGEYARFFDADPAWSRRFQPIEVREPTPAETEALLRRIAPGYERHHGVRYGEGAVEAAVALTARYLPARRMPDKAIDALDEAAATAAGRGSASVSRADVAAAVSRASGMRVEEGERRTAELGAALRTRVTAQDAACETVAAVVRRARSGLFDGAGPLASLVLAGPRGCGKSLLAEALGAAMDVPVHTLDMAEFREEHSVSRLIGSPPGYIGHGQGGQLTEAVRRTPACVVVLERVDEAHPNVLSVVRGVLEKGTLTDTSGRLVAFGGAVVAMTVTREGGPRRAIGFGAGEAPTEDARLPAGLADAVDAVVEMPGLSRGAVLSLVEGRLDGLRARAAAKGIALSVDPDAAALLADAALGRGEGAKPVRRILREAVEDKVAAALSDGVPSLRVAVEGGRVAVREVASATAAAVARSAA